MYPTLDFFPFNLALYQWGKVPRVGNSRLSDVYASPAPSGLQSAIMDAWGGACKDTKRKELVVTGGGHTDYAGNEWYAYGLDYTTANWQQWRIRNYYSTAGAGDTEAASGGGMASRHTYSILQYDPIRDVYVIGAGGGLWGPTGGFTFGCWEMDATVESPSSFSNVYTRKDDWTSQPTGPIGANLVYSPIKNKFYQINGGLSEFTPTAGTGSQWNNVDSFENNANNIFGAICIPGTSTYDRVFSTGGGGARVQRLVSPWTYEGNSDNDYGFTGDTEIQSAGTGIGMAWDGYAGKVICWLSQVSGSAGRDNRDTWEFDLVKKVIQRRSNWGDIPGNTGSNGSVFGRFQNLNDLGPQWRGLNILVTSTSTDPLFYRSSPAPWSRAGFGSWPQRLGA